MSAEAEAEAETEAATETPIPISIFTPAPVSTLADLQAKFPRWTFWMGDVTHEPWAAAPPEYRLPLVNAMTMGELAAKVEEQDARGMSEFIS